MPDSTLLDKSSLDESEVRRQKKLAYHREWMRNWRAKNPELSRQISRKSTAKNRDKIVVHSREYYLKNRERVIAQNCIYARANRKKINARIKTRQAADPEKTKLISRQRYLAYREKDKARRAARREELASYMRRKRNEDPKFLVADRLRRRINSALTHRETRKAGGLIELSGCTLDELVAYIEKQFADGMSWDNRRQWHIDHIVPCSAFDLTDPAEQRIAFHYSNLRPIWSSENQRKHAKIPGGQRKFFWSHDDIKKARQRLA